MHEMKKIKIRIVVSTLIVLGVLGGVYAVCFVNFGNHPPRRIGPTRVSIANIIMAADLFKLDCGVYPTETQGLDALLRNPGVTNWSGPYLKQLPPDAWGNPFQYSIVNRKPEIRSSGPDNRIGTEDDITN